MPGPPRNPNSRRGQAEIRRRLLEQQGIPWRGKIRHAEDERWRKRQQAEADFAAASVNPQVETRFSNHNRAYHLIRKCGITLGDVDVMRTAQGGKCAICGSEGVALCVDHDHATGRVRGLLCRMCNTALGQFGDSPERLMAAVRYLGGGGFNGAKGTDSQPEQ